MRLSRRSGDGSGDSATGEDFRLVRISILAVPIGIIAALTAYVV